AAGDQKQLDAGGFDEAVLARVRSHLSLPRAAVVHPSAMFRLLRQFWLGTESLQHVLDHTVYARVNAAAASWCPPLPQSFIAVKFYTGRTLPESDATRDALCALLERV